MCAHNAIFFLTYVFWYPFLEPHDHQNIDAQLRSIIKSGTSILGGQDMFGPLEESL